MEDAVLIEVTVKVAEKLLNFYEAGLIARADLDRHMNVKLVFFRKLLESGNYKNSDMQSVLERYEGLKRTYGV